MIKSIYNSVYLAIFLYAARKIKDKLYPSRSWKYVVFDYPGSHLAVGSQAKPEIKDGFSEPGSDGISIIRILSERKIAELAMKTGQEVITLSEAVFRYPELYRLSNCRKKFISDLGPFKSYKPQVAVAVHRIHKMMKKAK